jgi:uncharacterized repeat protein (TIGR02543 family)
MNLIDKKTIIIAAAAACSLAGTALFRGHTITLFAEDSDQEINQVEHTAFQKSALPELTTVGKTFTGWYNDKGQKFDGSGILFSDEQLHARFEPNTYSLILHDGSEIVQTEYTYGKQAVIEVPESFLAAHPYEDFVSYANEAEQRKIITAWTIGDKEYTARWTGKTYQIHYVLDGGITDNPSSYQYGEGTGLLQEADKEGYVFDGWYTDPEKKHPISAVSKDTHGDLTLYAGYHAFNQVSAVSKNVQNSMPASSSSPAANNSSYVWTSIQGGQAEIDAGYLVDYSGSGYYAAHAHTGYGTAIASLQPGQCLTVNGNLIQIDGTVYGNYNTDDLFDIYDRAGGQKDAMFQTCIGDAGDVVVKYGHIVK